MEAQFPLLAVDAPPARAAAPAAGHADGRRAAAAGGLDLYVLVVAAVLAQMLDAASGAWMMHTRGLTSELNPLMSGRSTTKYVGFTATGVVTKDPNIVKCSTIHPVISTRHNYAIVFVLTAARTRETGTLHIGPCNRTWTQRREPEFPGIVHDIVDVDLFGIRAVA